MLKLDAVLGRASSGQLVKRRRSSYLWGPGAKPYFEAVQPMNLRTLAIWGVIIVVLIGLYSMVTGGGKVANAGDITYSQLLTRVNSGQVKSAEISGPSVTVTDQAGHSFKAMTPNNQDDLVKRFEAQG